MQKASRRTEISFCNHNSMGNTSFSTEPLQALRMRVIASIFCLFVCFLNWFSALKVQAVAWGRLPKGKVAKRGRAISWGKGKGWIDSNGGIVGYIS